jgi:hypothetical protein
MRNSSAASRRQGCHARVRYPSQLSGVEAAASQHDSESRAGKQADERCGRVSILAERGRPEPTVLQLGISDETSAEVLSGALRPGQEVMTGVLTTTMRASSAPPGVGSTRF